MNRWEESLKVSLDLIVARPEELLQYEEMLKDSFPPELGSGSYWPGTRSKWISYCLIIGNPSASSKMT
ncbi:MAG: hypothetical protein KA522_01790 [Candidatus Saccharicenans sp.]|nr:hypothetical protein [Candidatus Saccharicenans sp.]